jgi:hypothetical protein
MIKFKASADNQEVIGFILAGVAALLVLGASAAHAAVDTR